MQYSDGTEVQIGHLITFIYHGLVCTQEIIAFHEFENGKPCIIAGALYLEPEHVIHVQPGKELDQRQFIVDEVARSLKAFHVGALRDIVHNIVDQDFYRIRRELDRNNDSINLIRFQINAISDWLKLEPREVSFSLPDHISRDPDEDD
jgi:hypothetical protein